MHCADGMSSNPTTDKSLGMLTDSSKALRIAPIAVRSFEQNTAVGLSDKDINAETACAPRGHCVISLNQHFWRRLQINLLHARVKCLLSPYCGFQMCWPTHKRDARVAQSGEVLHSLAYTVLVINLNG
jgi:hypothetical protein